MKRINDLQELVIEELQDLYDAEHQIMDALPEVIEAAESEELTKALQEHLEQTQEHVNRLEEVFKHLGESPERKRCKGMTGILKEGEDVTKLEGNAAVIDVALIAAAQRVEHYEIGVYGCLREWCQVLGHEDAAQILQQTLEEEEAADAKLTEIAAAVNAQAAAHDPEDEEAVDEMDDAQAGTMDEESINQLGKSSKRSSRGQ